MKKALTAVGTSLAALAWAASPAFAQNLGVPQPPGFQIDNLGLFVSRILGLALMVAGILVFVYLVWGGINWITSGGDKGKTEEARNRITAALVGLAIVAAAWAIMQLISYFFGINVLDANAPIPKAYE